MEPRILVLDGNQRAGLAAVRSLGAKGLWVAVGESSSPSMAGVSRFCNKTLTYADPLTSPRRFFEDLLLQINELNISFLLPITEATTYVILAYRDELPGHVTLPFPETASVERLANKNGLFQLALRQGVPVPETVFCDNADEGLRALETIDRFPVVLKPFKSKILLPDAIVSTQVIIAHSYKDARDALNEHVFFKFPFTIQSFVEGSGQGVFALFDHGEPVCFFAHRRLREKPPSGGVSVLCESAPVSDKLRTYAEKLLRAAHWHGVAMVEFRVSPDGTPYLMEVNPRFWGSLQLAIDSGINFPWWLYLASTGEPVPPGTWQRRRVRWLLGDLDRLYLVLKASSGEYSFWQKIKELGCFLKPNRHTHHEVNRVSDFRPFLFELKRYLQDLKHH